MVKKKELPVMADLGWLNDDFNRENIIEPIMQAAKILGFKWVEKDSFLPMVQKYVCRDLNCYYRVDSSG